MRSASTTCGHAAQLLEALGQQPHRRGAPSGRGRRARTASGSRPARRRTPASRPRWSSRSPGARRASAPTAGTPAAAGATQPLPRPPPAGSCGPSRCSRRPGPSAAAAWPRCARRCRTFSSISSRTTSVFLAARRGGRSNAPAGRASITRLTVLWVVPHSAAAPDRSPPAHRRRRCPSSPSLTSGVVPLGGRCWFAPTPSPPGATPVDQVTRWGLSLGHGWGLSHGHGHLLRPNAHTALACRDMPVQGVKPSICTGP